MAQKHVELLHAKQKQLHAQTNYDFRVEQLVECKKLLRNTEEMYLECLVPSFKKNGSMFSESGSLLAALDVEHPSISKVLTTSEGVTCSGKFFEKLSWNKSSD